jgi:hypothetical protein
VLHRQWDLAGTHGYRLPAKWISEDGLAMTLVFSGVKPFDAFCTRMKRSFRNPAEIVRERKKSHSEARNVRHDQIIFREARK